MVTIHDLTWDDDRLFELFLMLDRRDQGLLMKQAAVTACYAVARQAGIAKGVPVTDPPEAVALKALQRCRPPLPCGWPSDTDFQFEVENTVLNRLGDRALDMVLTTTDHDEGNASVLADWAETHAQRIGNDFCAPSSEDGYVTVDDMRRFIEDWRDSFMSNLRRKHAELPMKPRQLESPP